jgi:hypothetical protein
MIGLACHMLSYYAIFINLRSGYMDPRYWLGRFSPGGFDLFLFCCLFPSLYLPICMFICLPACLSVRLSVFLIVWTWSRLSAGLSFSQSVSAYHDDCAALDSHLFAPLVSVLEIAVSIQR